MAAEISGLEQYSQVCPTEPNVLTDAEVIALSEALHAAVALPTPDEREAAIRQNVLEPMAQAHQQLRHCDLYERGRADAILSLVGRYNQIVREQH